MNRGCSINIDAKLNLGVFFPQSCNHLIHFAFNVFDDRVVLLRLYTSFQYMSNAC